MAEPKVSVVRQTTDSESASTIHADSGEIDITKEYSAPISKRAPRINATQKMDQRVLRRLFQKNANPPGMPAAPAMESPVTRKPSQFIDKGAED